MDSQNLSPRQSKKITRQDDVNCMRKLLGEDNESQNLSSSIKNSQMTGSEKSKQINKGIRDEFRFEIKQINKINQELLEEAQLESLRTFTDEAKLRY